MKERTFRKFELVLCIASVPACILNFIGRQFEDGLFLLALAMDAFLLCLYSVRVEKLESTSENNHAS